MRIAGPNQARRKDIEAAITAAKPKDMLTLEALAVIWGTSKTNFVNAKTQMADFPAPIVGLKNSHSYPARKALSVMLAHEKRHDAMKAEKRDRTAAMAGTGPRKASAHDPLPINEMAAASRLAAETEERERAQREKIPADEVVSVASSIFSLCSARLSELDRQIDPNGRLDPSIRASLQTEGRNLLLLIHGEMKYMLSPDAIRQPRELVGSGSASRRAGRRRAPRKGG